MHELQVSCRHLHCFMVVVKLMTLQLGKHFLEVEFTHLRHELGLMWRCLCHCWCGVRIHQHYHALYQGQMDVPWGPCHLAA